MRYHGSVDDVLRQWAAQQDAPRETVAAPEPKGWRNTADLLALPQPTWLPGLDDTITTDGVHLLAGASGAGKTQLALRWAALASGAGVAVGYVPAEDETQFTARLPALRHHFGDPVDQIRWWHQTPVLDGGEEHAELAQRLSLDPVGLLFIDTLSAAAGLYDEMKPETVLEKMRLATALGHAGNCAVVVLAHTGWDTTRVMGSSSIRRELRTSWVIETQGEQGELRLRQDKVRLGKQQSPRYFRIKDVETDPPGPVLVEGDGAAQQRNHAKRIAVEHYMEEGTWPRERALATEANVSNSTAHRALKEAKAEVD